MSTITNTLAIDVHDLHKSYDGVPVLTGIDLEVPTGGFLAIIGPSGCGKSTLLRVLAGLETPTSGDVRTHSRPGVGFQDARLLPWRRVWENVTLGIEGSRSTRRRTAEQVLAEVGLEQFAEAWPSTLSGGQAQRVALARELTLNPEILLLDEPFGAVDALTRLRMHALVRRLWQEHRLTVLLVTHDVDEAVLLADQVLVLDQGIVADRFAIDLPYPRRRTTSDFDALRTRILAGLGVDEDRE